LNKYNGVEEPSIFMAGLCCCMSLVSLINNSRKFGVVAKVSGLLKLTMCEEFPFP